MTEKEQLLIQEHAEAQDEASLIMVSAKEVLRGTSERQFIGFAQHQYTYGKILAGAAQGLSNTFELRHLQRALINDTLCCSITEEIVRANELLFHERNRTWKYRVSHHHATQK